MTFNFFVQTRPFLVSGVLASCFLFLHCGTKSGVEIEFERAETAPKEEDFVEKGQSSANSKTGAEPKSEETEILEVSKSTVLLRATEQWKFQPPAGKSIDEYLFEVELKNPASGMQAGAIGTDGILISPSQIPENHEGSIVVVRSKATNEVLYRTEIRFIDFAVADDGVTKALVGNVYDLNPKSSSESVPTKLPDFSTLTSVAKVMIPNFDLPNRDFTRGFPGISNLVEYFGIRFDGRISIENEGRYTFKLRSDDGAKMYIDGLLVCDNDGTHSEKDSTPCPLDLTKGSHTFRLDYFQGPKTKISLSLFWTIPGETASTIVPAQVFERPAM
jgi:hypothetical protein